MHKTYRKALTSDKMLKIEKKLIMENKGSDTHVPN